jgi:hypothetical protein
MHSGAYQGPLRVGGVGERQEAHSGVINSVSNIITILVTSCFLVLRARRDFAARDEAHARGPAREGELGLSRVRGGSLFAHLMCGDGDEASGPLSRRGESRSRAPDIHRPPHIAYRLQSPTRHRHSHRVVGVADVALEEAGWGHGGRRVTHRGDSRVHEAARAYGGESGHACPRGSFLHAAKMKMRGVAGSSSGGGRLEYHEGEPTRAGRFARPTQTRRRRTRGRRLFSSSPTCRKWPQTLQTTIVENHMH